MPVPYHQLNPKDRYTLGEGAKDGMLLQVRCMLCMAPAQVFLAEDLVQLAGAGHDFYEPFQACPRCKTAEFVRVKLRTPYDVDVGKLMVRRLVRIDLRPRWRNELFEPKPRPPDPPSSPPTQS